MSKPKQRDFLCIGDGGYAASHLLRIIDRGPSDPEAESHWMLRVIDESGEDYLFPASLLVPIEVPEEAAEAFVGGQPEPRDEAGENRCEAAGFAAHPRVRWADSKGLAEGQAPEFYSDASSARGS